jgi:polysaccharide chain length determinant protein (PEP-CTERM system associated)
MLPGRKYTPAIIGKIVWKGKWLLVIPAVLGLFVGLMISRAQPELYKAETLIQVLPQRVAERLVVSTVTSTIEERLKSIQEQLRSRTFLEEMVTSLDLYPEMRRTHPMDDIVEAMRDNMPLVQVAGTSAGTWRAPGTVNALRVVFTYEDKAKALQVAQRVTSYLVNENARMRGSLAQQTNDFLEQQLAQVKQQLVAQEGKVEDFRRRNSGRLPTQLDSNQQGLLNTQMQLQSHVQSLAADRDRKMLLERLYSEGQAELRQMAAAAPPPTTTVPTPGADPTAQLANASATQRLAMAKAQLSAAELRLKPEHPDIRRFKRIVADLEKQAAAEAAQAPTTDTAQRTSPGRVVSPEEASRRETLRQQRAEIDSLGRQIAFKDNEERRLRAVINDYQSRIEAIPSNESEWTSLTRDYNTLQENYRNLLVKSEDSKVSLNLEKQQIGEQFRVLDSARVSDETEGSNRLQINAGGLVFGFILGLVVVGLREFLDTSFRSDVDVLNALALPVLATVPFAPSPADVSRDKRRRLLVSMSGVAVAVVVAGVFWYLKLWKFVA